MAESARSVAVESAPHELTEPMRPASTNLQRAWRRLRRNRSAVFGLVVVGILVFSAIFAPGLAPYDPYRVDLDNRLQPPGGAHVLGTDELGRDILSRLLYGARVSLWVGIVTVAASALIGASGGLVAGYLGGYWDVVIMRIVDIFL